MGNCCGYLYGKLFTLKKTIEKKTRRETYFQILKKYPKLIQTNNLNAKI